MSNGGYFLFLSLLECCFPHADHNRRHVCSSVVPPVSAHLICTHTHTHPRAHTHTSILSCSSCNRHRPQSQVLTESPCVFHAAVCQFAVKMMTYLWHPWFWNGACNFFHEVMCLLVLLVVIANEVSWSVKPRGPFKFKHFVMLHAGPPFSLFCVVAVFSMLPSYSPTHTHSENSMDTCVFLNCFLRSFVILFPRSLPDIWLHLLIKCS